MQHLCCSITALLSESEQMRRTGVRRICIISGDAGWVSQSAEALRRSLAGDWLTVSSDPETLSPCIPPAAVRQLLGREFRHAIFDARSGFHAEALATVAGTLLAGSWLLLLLPPREKWDHWQDQDSLRWADTAEAIAVPGFMQHLQSVLASLPDVSYLEQHQPVSVPPLAGYQTWHCRAPAQQTALLHRLQAMPHGVAVVTAPRGRGKSALAGMLARNNPGALISAPAKVSTEVLQQFAGQHFQFMAPDALLAEGITGEGWLIVDEAAAIPAPVLQQMVSRFRRVLLCTTVQGYEGTGRGFLLKFCAGLPEAAQYTLSEPLRWAANDPLERFIDALFLFDDSTDSPAGTGNGIRRLPPAAWSDEPAKAQAVYRLLTAAHYRTSPLDLRRMMDAPGMTLLVDEAKTGLRGALWLLEEGGLSLPLSQAVWAGFRRPKGNLVAQSLAAHAGFPQAACMRSLRISRIAVHPQVRRQGRGLALVMAAIAAAEEYDYLSVSFGYTPELWHFWRSCGFRLVRLGTQREASSGCYAAMAIIPRTAAAEQLVVAAERRLSRDGACMRQRGLSDPGLPVAEEDSDTALSDEDWRELAAFAWGRRPFESAFPALMRLQANVPLSFPCLSALSAEEGAICEQQSVAAAGGRKSWLRLLREDVAQALSGLNSSAASQWARQLQALQKV